MLKTCKYVFENNDVRITVLSKLDSSALSACNNAIKSRNAAFPSMTIRDMVDKQESNVELTVENARLLLCEWKRD